MADWGAVGVSQRVQQTKETFIEVAFIRESSPWFATKLLEKSSKPERVVLISSTGFSGPKKYETQVRH